MSCYSRPKVDVGLYNNLIVLKSEGSLIV